MKKYPEIGLQIPEILIPREASALPTWAVVACDQFTSQPKYWESVKSIVGESPSTYNLILPEAYLGTELEEHHRAKVNPAMRDYLTNAFFQTINGMIYVERSVGKNIRKGLMACLDLEAYDFSSNSQSLIRATEGTIVDRLPPRIRIREEALIEIPHILVLIDDPGRTVIEPLHNLLQGNDVLYEFDLMLDGGHIRGYQIVKEAVEEGIIHALRSLKSDEVQKKKYQVRDNQAPLLFAVGDGNHSLATAKSVWEKRKNQLPENHPARYALVEIVNLHDEGIAFEAIHRLIKNITIDKLIDNFKVFDSDLKIIEATDFAAIRNSIAEKKLIGQRFGLFSNGRYYLATIGQPAHTLTVGTVQHWLDEIIQKKGSMEIDYIHGDDSILELGSLLNNTGVYLPAMPKDALFRSVITDGPLPRKTFSMGEANQKRYYLECRKIQ